VAVADAYAGTCTAMLGRNDGDRLLRHGLKALVAGGPASPGGMAGRWP
jgi:hypothetical protein